MDIFEQSLQVKLYSTGTGNIPVADFMDDLLPEEFKYFDRAITRCETLSLSDLKKSHYLGKLSGCDLYEIRISAKNKIFRILCVIKDSIIWLLHAFQKKSQKIERKEISTALNRFTQLKLSKEYLYGI